MSHEQYGTIDELINLAEETLTPIVKDLRRVILEIDPNACEVVRLGDRAATYGIGPKKMSEGYCYILPYKSWVNLGFYKGVKLHDPEGLLEGTGKNMRHIKIRTIEEVDRPAVKKLIEAALSERKSALNA